MYMLKSDRLMIVKNASRSSIESYLGRQEVGHRGLYRLRSSVKPSPGACSWGVMYGLPGSSRLSAFSKK